MAAILNPFARPGYCKSNHGGKGGSRRAILIAPDSCIPNSQTLYCQLLSKPYRPPALDATLRAD